MVISYVTIRAEISLNLSGFGRHFVIGCITVGDNYVYDDLL